MLIISFWNKVLHFCYHLILYVNSLCTFEVQFFCKYVGIHSCCSSAKILQINWCSWTTMYIHVCSVCVCNGLCKFYSELTVCWSLDFYYTKLPGSEALLVASQYALPGYSDRRVWVQGPGWPDHLCQVTAAYALRLNSQAVGEGSTVSSLNCDHWLILVLCLEALSH